MNPTIKNKYGGRMPGIISYIDVSLNNKDYIVGTVKHNNTDINFVFDKEDFNKVSQRAWHLSAGQYIASTFYYTDEITNIKHKKELYLHNLVMNKLDFPGKGAKESVDHISRNTLDNRKSNLRIVTQSEQNINQKTRSRIATLPEGCQIDISDIPRHIWYIKANGAHGDRFAIEFVTENICWKTTSSKKVSLRDKLEQAKTKLKELYTTYPYLDPSNDIRLHESKQLQNEFEEILKLATNT
jgi:HNH endonuclease